MGFGHGVRGEWIALSNTLKGTKEKEVLTAAWRLLALWKSRTVEEERHKEFSFYHPEF